MSHTLIDCNAITFAFVSFFVETVDVAQSIHFEGTLRQTEWQTKAVRTTSKAIIKGVAAIQKSTDRDDRVRKTSEFQIKSRKLTAKKYNTSNSSYVAKSKLNASTMCIHKI